MPNPSCTGFPAVTCVFTATGGAISWPVPAGVTSLSVTADGGSGADAVSNFAPNGGGSGGPGGEYEATLSGIPAGTVLSIFPGNAANGISGGVNATGRGGNSSRDTEAAPGPDNGGGGGGASTVAIRPFSVARLLVVAGGGGGGAAENNNTPPLPGSNGGAGGGSATPNGANGGPGAPYTNNWGRGGTATAGGPAGGGTLGGCLAQASGTQLMGGDAQRGRTCRFAGGAGGSGYFGGGGGGTGGGGGGGSAFPASTTTVGGIQVTPVADSSTHMGAGVVTITYMVPIRRTRLQLFAQRNFGVLTLFARLTGDGRPLAGQPVSFGTWRSTVLCTNKITNSNGVATCQLTRQQTQSVDGYAGFYTATYAGGGGIPGTSAYSFAP